MDTTQENTNLMWQDHLAAEKQKPYFQSIIDFLKQEQAKGKIIYPQQKNIFNAIKLTPLETVKVVIIGQDPYHGTNQAHGLSFSVQKSIPTPPSLQNIFKEIQSDLGISPPQHGCLEAWAKQGVLLLNAVLTVEAGQPQSHANKGWEIFTDKIIEILNTKKEKLVFLLWGSQAQRKGQMINPIKHYVLKAPHPSPLSAHRGFLGCKHFSKTNAFLEKSGKIPVDWHL